MNGPYESKGSRSEKRERERKNDPYPVKPMSGLELDQPVPQS